MSEIKLGNVEIMFDVDNVKDEEIEINESWLQKEHKDKIDFAESIGCKLNDIESDPSMFFLHVYVDTGDNREKREQIADYIFSQGIECCVYEGKGAKGLYDFEPIPNEVTKEEFNQTIKELYESFDELHKTCDKINKNLDYWNEKNGFIKDKKGATIEFGDKNEGNDTTGA